jgi:hypothetical protein
MATDLRVVIQVFDNATMQESHGSAPVVLSIAQQDLIAKTSDALNPAQWVAEELTSILRCLEYIDGPDRIEES